MPRTWLPLVPMTLVVVDGPESAEYRGPVPQHLFRVPIFNKAWAREIERVRQRPAKLVTYHRRDDFGSQSGG